MSYKQIFVLYDGIHNSVFQGQVLQPLLKKLNNAEVKQVLLVSFEKKLLSQKQIRQAIPAQKNLELIILKKRPFFGALSLYPAVYQLKKILKQKQNYHLVARGPLAGWLCARALNLKDYESFTVQARGLLAAEYRYVTRSVKNPIKKLWYWLRTQQFAAVEKSAYRNKHAIIEAVSPALKDHLVNKFDVQPSRITIATADLPEKFNAAQVASWRQEIRTELGISQTTHVYCFNGSAKPWQCPDQVAVFFSEQLAKKPDSFLLVLTQDRTAFEALLKMHTISEKKYKVLTVLHAHVYRYLSACDTGLIFREPNVVNWVSRPTKVLEYRAVGLHVIHNNTIAWLLLPSSIRSL